MPFRKRNKNLKKIQDLTIAIFTKIKFFIFAEIYFLAKIKYGDFSLKSIVLGKLKMIAWVADENAISTLNTALLE